MDGTLEAFLTACRMHLKHGTTSIMPTSMSCFDDELFQLFDCFEQAKPIRENMPHLLGLHLEGPYFSPEQAGAQPAECMTVPFPDLGPQSGEYQAVVLGTGSPRSNRIG